MQSPPRAAQPPAPLPAALQEAFAYFDADRDGRITFAELPTVLRSVGYLLTQAEARALTRRLLPTHLGFLTPADLQAVCATLPTPSGFNARPPAATLAYLRDQLARGALAQANRVALLCTTGEGLTAQEYAALTQLGAQSIKHGFSIP